MTESIKVPFTDIETILASVRACDELRICLLGAALPGYGHGREPDSQAFLLEQEIRVICIIRDGVVIAKWDLSRANLVFHGDGRFPFVFQIRLFLNMLRPLLAAQELQYHTLRVWKLQERVWDRHHVLRSPEGDRSPVEILLDPRFERRSDGVYAIGSAQLKECTHISIQIASLSASWSAQSSP